MRQAASAASVQLPIQTPTRDHAGIGTWKLDTGVDIDKRQKERCTPSWIVLLFRAVRVMRPNAELLGSETGSANCG